MSKNFLLLNDKFKFYQYRQYLVSLIGPLREINIVGSIDTGYEFSMVGQELAEAIGAKIEMKHPCFEHKLVNGEILRMGSVKIKVRAEGKEFPLRPLVVTDPSIKSIVLGWDFFKAVNYLPLYIRQFSMLYNHIKVFKKRCVLIIGNYTIKDSLGTLQRIQNKLQKLGYEAVLLREYPDIQEQTIEEKMVLFGSVAKFVICENSFYSGHIDELSICARNRFVTVILQEKRRHSTWLQTCYPIDFNFIKKIRYTEKTLDYNVRRAVKIAESLITERKRVLNREYRYRKEWLNELSGKG